MGSDPGVSARMVRKTQTWRRPVLQFPSAGRGEPSAESQASLGSPGPRAPRESA